jgi:hypothetical protein
MHVVTVWAYQLLVLVGMKVWYLQLFVSFTDLVQNGMASRQLKILQWVRLKVLTIPLM